MKPRLTLMAVVGMVGVVSMILQAATATGPAWWVTRGTINTNLPPNDFAAVNQGQLKWMAVNAAMELESQLPGGAGSNVWWVISQFTETNNYHPVNLGQLKYVAQPFWSNLIAVGYATNYPWSGQANDYALANIGQMKCVFSFAPSSWMGMDFDGDGMTNGWEVANGSDWQVNDTNSVSSHPWAHGLLNLQVYQNPSVLFSNNYSSLQDGVPDWWKLIYGYGTNTGASVYGTNGLTLAQNYQYGRNPLIMSNDVIIGDNSGWTRTNWVQVLPLQRSYPWLLISSEAMMTNAALMAVGATNVLSYTLPASNDQYVIYFQFADNGTNAVCDVFGKIVGYDTVPPTVQITGPTTNATGTGNQLFIHLQATVCDSKVYNAGTLDSARPLKVWLNGNPYWGRRSGQLDIPRFRVQPNTNNVITILAQDTAGNTNAATLTWTVNGNGDTTAPVLSNFNVAAYTLLPDMEQVWIQADCDDSNAVVRAQVTPADGDPSDPWNMTWLGTNGFGTHVPLAWGTNTLQMVAFDAAGNATTNSFILERSDRYTAQMTSPEPGTFAAGDEYVSGRVGKLIDVGLPTETTVTNVAINGVLVELMDWGDEFLWVSTNAVNGSSLRRVWPVVMTLYLADNTTRELPLGLVEGYEIVIKRTDSEFNEPEYDTTSDGSYTSYPYMWWFLYLFEPWAFGTDNESSTWLDPDGITNEEAWSSLQPSVPPIDRGSNTGWLWWPAWVGSDSLGDGGRALFLGWATDHYTWQWWVNDFWSRKDWPWEARADGFMVFRAPLYCGTGTTVLLTLQGVGYRYDGVSDLSQVKLWGQSPVAWSNEIGEVSYLVTLDKDTLYTFGPDSFTWPEGDSWTTNEIGTLDGFPTKSVETWHGHRIWFTDFHNELPPLEVKVTNGPEKHGGVKPWVNNQTGEAWVGISMFPTPTFKNKDAFVVLKVEHEWKNLTNAAGQAFVPSQLGYDPIYYVRRFSTDVDAKMSGEETTQHTNYVRGLYFALVDSCTNRPAEWQGEPPCLESCITNSTGNLEINFTYMVYEGTPDVKSLGFENTHYWLDYITDWGKFRAYANEASHGVSSFVEPSPDKLKRYKMLGGTKNHKLLLKWNTRSEPNRQQLIRTPYIEDGPNRFGR